VKASFAVLVFRHKRLWPAEAPGELILGQPRFLAGSLHQRPEGLLPFRMDGFSHTGAVKESSADQADPIIGSSQIRIYLEILPTLGSPYSGVCYAAKGRDISGAHGAFASGQRNAKRNCVRKLQSRRACVPCSAIAAERIVSPNRGRLQGRIRPVWSRSAGPRAPQTLYRRERLSPPAFANSGKDFRLF